MTSELKSNIRYKTIVELAPDVVYTISKNGKLTSLSSAFEKLTEYKREEWIGKNFSGIVHPVDLPKALVNFARTLKGETRSHYTLRIKKKNGEYLRGEFKSAPDVENGKIIGVIGIGRDITSEDGKHEELLHYKKIVQSADSAIISRDRDGYIQTWNYASEKLFGYKASEVVGKHFSILIPKENKDELKKINEKIIKGKYLEDYETIRVKKNGKKIDVIAKISPIRDEKGNIIGTSVFDRDNTIMKKEKEYERYLAEGNKILFSSLNYNTTLKRLARILVPEIADWCAIHTEDKGNLNRLVVAHEDPKKVKWVESLQKKYGSTDDKKSVAYRVFNSGKAELYSVIDEKLIVKAAQNEEQAKLIRKLNLRSVMIVPIKTSKGTLGVISLVSSSDNRHYDKQDLKFVEELARLAGQAIENATLYHMAKEEIIKRKRIESELRASKDQLDAIFENAADGITVFDKNANVIFVNNSIAIESGYKSVNDMVKNPLKWKQIYEVMSENDEKLEVKDLPGRRAVYSGKDAAAILHTLNKKTGEEKWSLVKARPIFNAEGEPNGSVSITHDITQLKELERRKDDFVSIASHELKTPITSIKGFIHLLKQEHVGYETSRSALFIKRIDSQLDKLNELVEDLLNLSRLQTGKLIYRSDFFDLSELVREVIGDLEITTNTHNIVFKNGIKKKIKGDRDRIGQVLINLISNAIKYSPKNGKILVSMKDERSSIGVSVKDYGIGMEESELDKVFDRFYRVKDINGRTFPGLGIGLYISKEIIERHNGKIWAKSKKRKGSTFQFSLPISN